jgi:tetratricopeptide (TPR) repeat protein
MLRLLFPVALASAAGLAQPSQPQKQIDIGAAQAPLSDRERTDLAAAVQRHNYAAEQAVIAKASVEHPMSWELLVMTGRLAYLEKKPKEAADALERADKIKPLAEDDRTTLALAEQFSGKPDSARSEFLKLTKAAPQNAQGFYLLGRFEVQNRHLEDAVTAFRKTIELDPKLFRAYQDLGQAQETLGLSDDARATYELGAVRNRLTGARWQWSPLDLGVSLMKDGELERSEKLFNEALVYNPRFSWAHYYLGQLKQKEGRSEEAIAEYKEAVVDEPTLRQAWLALGREYTRLGQKAEADKVLGIFKDLETRENVRLHGAPGPHFNP